MKLIWQNEFERMANAEPKAEMFAYYDENMGKTSIARMEFFSMASRAASILRGAGVQRGDTVLVALPLCPEGAVAHYGAIFAGAAVVHSEYSPDNPDLFLHVVKQSTAKFLVMRSETSDSTWSEFKDKVGHLKPGNLAAQMSESRMPNIKKAFVLHRGGDNDFLSQVKSHGGCYMDRDVNENQLASLYLTSGTTGVPKLVMRSHKSLVLDGRSGVFPDEVAPKGQGRRFYQNAPWSWVVSSSFDLLDGYTRVHPDLWHKPKDQFRMYANIIRKDGVRNMFLTPPELEGIQKIWGDNSKKISGQLLIAGFPVTKQLCSWLLSASEMLVVRFGCSEMISICYNIIRKEEDFEDFDCGIIYPGTTVRAVNENMEDMPKGSPGRLLMKCSSMFDGYLGQPDKTKEALSDDGWYITSDAGYIDNKNHLFIIGRYDYVIKHKGRTYYPSSIETIVRAHPQVKEVVVVPVPHDKNFHNACAYVVKEPGAKITENDVMKSVADAAANKNASNVVAPQHVIFVDCIDRSNRGKVNRNKLIEDAIKVIKG